MFTTQKQIMLDGAGLWTVCALYPQFGIGNSVFLCDATFFRFLPTIVSQNFFIWPW